MGQPELGKLDRKDPREIWQHEARDFTPWLMDNILLLSQALGIDIEAIQREVSVGEFAVDIFGKETGSGREVIIENQLAATDHSHLGQLLTYAAGLDAKVVVWLSPQFRDEHKQTIDWLNRHTAENLSFFGVELELFTIGNSLPAPNFKVVAQPSEWQEDLTATTAGGYSELRQAYHEFFTDLLNRLKARSPGFTNMKNASYDSWISFGVGRTGFGVGANFFAGNRFRVELYIDPDGHDVNKRAFDLLHDERAQIEGALDEALEWERLDHRRASRTYVPQDGGIHSPPETLDALKGWAVERLVRFKDVFAPRVRALRLEESLEAAP